MRETWAHYQTVGLNGQVSDGYAGYRADGFDSIEDFRSHVKDESEGEAEHVLINGDRWRPSIHMPRWASRITLEVTGVRVERVADITAADALAEGVTPIAHGNDPGDAEDAALWAFKRFWDSINAKWGYGWGANPWAANPWVWVVEFKVVTP